MHLLVTGGAGFIGSNFVRYWVDHHPDDSVVAYDALTYAGNRPSLADVEDRISFVRGDVCDREFALQTLRTHSIDTVVHFAAESHNSLAILDPGLFFSTNVLGTQALLEVAHHRFDPLTVLAWGPSGDVPLLDGRTVADGVPAAYVCRGFVCRAPVTEAAELEAELAGPRLTGQN